MAQFNTRPPPTSSLTMRTSKPLPFQLPLLIAAIAVIVITWLAAWQYVQQTLIRTAGKHSAWGVAEIASNFDRMVFERYGDLHAMAVVFSNGIKDDPAFVQRYLDTVRDTYEAYHWLGVADREGRLVGTTSAESPRGMDVSGPPGFRRSRTGSGRVGCDAAWRSGCLPDRERRARRDRHLIGHL